MIVIKWNSILTEWLFKYIKSKFRHYVVIYWLNHCVKHETKV